MRAHSLGGHPKPAIDGHLPDQHESQSEPVGRRRMRIVDEDPETREGVPAGTPRSGHDQLSVPGERALSGGCRARGVPEETQHEAGAPLGSSQPKSLTFLTVGQERNVTLSPF